MQVTSDVLAGLASVLAVASALVFVASPVYDAFGSHADGPGIGPDAILLTLLTIGLSAAVIVSLHRSGTSAFALVVRFIAAGLMTATGLAAVRFWNPSSIDLAVRFDASPSPETGSPARYEQFRSWAGHLAALSWAYLACALALLAIVVVFALWQRNRRSTAPSCATKAA